MSVSKELLQIASQLAKYQDYHSPELDALVEAANDIGESWSGSWLGYQSRVYYADFQPPPPGAHFSVEWGGRRDVPFDDRTRGEWREYDFDFVEQSLYRKAGNPSLDQCSEESNEATELFEEAQQSILSLVHLSYDFESDEFLRGLVTRIESYKASTEDDIINLYRPSGSFISQDWRAIEKGLTTPPHMAVLSKVIAAKWPFQVCKDLKKHIVRLANHVQNLEKKTIQEDRMGTHVFIGHGHSHQWRDLKDFISERLKLPWDEFNRVPIAGVTSITRLAQMLDQACIALLVMTAEDEDTDGHLHARMNVIHEAGLFQGRLGFERAIILLEEGCQEFSNIQGLGQIRFPKGNIKAIFEPVRQVLEREGIIG